MTEDERLDNLCVSTTDPDILNALYECRNGRPNPHPNAHKWRDASALVAQSRVLFVWEDQKWLKQRALQEAREQ